MKRILTVLAVMMAVAAAGGGQVRSKKRVTKQAPRKVGVEAAAEFRLRSLRITGASRLSVSAIERELGLKMGEPVTAEDFESARKRLIDTGAFSSVAYSYGPAEDQSGYAATYEVAEVEQAYPVRFRGFEQTPEQLQRQLAALFPLYGDRLPATEPAEQRYRDALAKVAGGAVRSKVTTEEGGALVVEFSAGDPPLVVAGVFFSGNELIKASTLQNTMNAVAVGVVFREDFFRELLERNARPLYEAKGRMGVKFTNVRAEPAGDVKGLRVNVTVEEGPEFQFGRVSVQGFGSEGERLRKLAEFQAGDAVNYDKVRVAARAMEQAVRRGGFLKVKVTPERAIQEEKKAVDVLFTVDPGPPFRFRRMEMEGLDIHGAAEVRKLWGMDAGKVYDPEYPQFFFEKLRERNVFDNLGNPTSRIELDERTQEVDVTLVFGK